MNPGSRRRGPPASADLDLVVDLAEDQVRSAVDTLLELGLRPRLPVNPHHFADPTVRRRGVEERALTVFSFHDPNNPLREVDLFADPPLAFSGLWERSVAVDLTNTTVRVPSIDDLIAMKRQAGRAQDLADVEALEELKRRGS